MLATKKQIAYLQNLADRAQFIKTRHPSLIPQGLMHTKFQLGLTTEEVGLRIQMYRNIVESAHEIMYPRKKVTENEDLPA